ncbi:MAG TPA: TRAP transporter substrate-binding protein DctP [Lacunisphaera sp.]|jgi:TRAP-type C4-dicarboxylate transport system substrate-binding protein
MKPFFLFTLSPFLSGRIRFALIPLLIAVSAHLPMRAANVTIRLGTILPSGTAQHQALKAMGEEWQKASGGSLKLILYPDGRLGGESEMVKKMRIKQLNACVLSVVGLSEIDPGVGGLQLMPLAFRTWPEVDYVREKMQPMLEERLRAKGYEVLFWADAGWVRFFSKERGLHPDDFKKMKIFAWAGDVAENEIMKSIGYHPVSLETSDILLGLNTDLINVVPVPPIVALAGQFYGPASHMLDLNWSPIVGAAVVRHDVWAKLSPEVQAKIRTISDATGAKIRQLSRAEDENSIKVMTEHGLKVEELTPEAEKEWRALGDAVLSKVRGNTVPADIFDEVQHRLAEFRSGPAPAKP